MTGSRLMTISFFMVAATYSCMLLQRALVNQLRMAQINNEWECYNNLKGRLPAWNTSCCVTRRQNRLGNIPRHHFRVIFGQTVTQLITVLIIEFWTIAWQTWPISGNCEITCLITKLQRITNKPTQTSQAWMKKGAILVQKSQALKCLTQSSSGRELQACVRGSFELTNRKYFSRNAQWR